VLAGRRREPLEQTVAEAGAGPDQVLVAPTDVADPEAVAALFDAAKERFGRLDVLFNNAGILSPASRSTRFRSKTGRPRSMST